MVKFRYPKMLSLAIALVLGCVAVPAGFAQKAKPKPKPKPKIIYYAVPAETTIRVRLDQDVSSKTARIGDPIRTTTVDPVYSSGGILLIPDGSVINGKVDSVSPAAKNGKPGNFGVSFTSVVLPNNRRATIVGMPVPLSEGKNVNDEGTVSAKKTSKRHLKFIGGGAAGGAVIGGIAGGGTGALIGAGVGAVGGLVGKNLSKGKEAEVKSGTEFGVYLGKGISLPKYAGAP
jgi:hypothetical protein